VLATRVSPDLRQTSTPVLYVRVGAGKCVAAAIDLSSPSDSTYLLLFGSGIRGRTARFAGTAVSINVRVDGQDAPPISTAFR